MNKMLTFLVVMVGFAGCRPEEYTPKPAGYFRIDTPARHEYRLFDMPGFPYTFEYPVYSAITNDTARPKGAEKHPYWINIDFPGMGGVINITYKEITTQQPLSKMVEDSWHLSFVHEEKAEYIHDTAIDNPYGSAGLLYKVGGNTASSYQFVCSDSVKHFIRGALYFDVTPNADSLKPANDFLVKDIEHLMMTLRWK